MKLLLDTQMLIWIAVSPDRVSSRVCALIEDSETTPVFSVISIWEVAIKYALNRPDFRIDPARLRGRALDHGYAELPVTSDHAIAVLNLPPIHKDPFDRLLLAQAVSECATLITADKLLARYPGVISGRQAAP